jgi:cytidyltransferase-like protein
MDRIFTLSEIEQTAYNHLKENNKVGLVTGCFDIVHFGHVDMFRFAKSHVDILLVGIESDKTAQATKNIHRPIFYQETRAQVLAEIRSIDFVCKFDMEVDYKRDDVDRVYEEITRRLAPSTIITNKLTDNYWINKKKRAEKLGLDFKGQQSVVFMGSTSKIIDILREMED